jgi:predicted DsbA family dithiol-disulfide isomerase
VKVHIWSDVVCPWCYIGKRHFEEALEGFEHRDEVEVVWRAYELDRTAPAHREGPYIDRLSRKYRVPVAEAQAMIDRITDAAAASGLDFRFDIAKPGNTFSAHKVIHLAAEHGLQDAMKERLLRATFTEGEPIGDADTLVRLAGDVGLDSDDVRKALADDRYSDAVRADQDEAYDIGISGVPFFLVDGRYGISGAHPATALRKVLQQAWDESHPVKPVVMVGDSGGDACADGSCAV